ncbi:MAG: DinB family protein [Dehalococcoidia bacterium]
MRVDDVCLLFAYDTWATVRLLRYAEGLNPDQFAIPPGPGHAPIRATLIHLIEARQTWRLRWQGQQDGPDVLEADFPTPASLRPWLVSEEATMQTTLCRCQDADLDLTMRWGPPREQQKAGTCWQLLLHVLQHGPQHRGEVAAALTLLGRSPGDMDFGDFLEERGAITTAG